MASASKRVQTDYESAALTNWAKGPARNYKCARRTGNRHRATPARAHRSPSTQLRPRSPVRD